VLRAVSKAPPPPLPLPPIHLISSSVDQLNFFMRERELPRAMRRELRVFFDQARRVREVNDDSRLLGEMSPLLQGTVAFAANRQWLRKIWWLHSIVMNESRESREFVAMLAKALQVSAYVASERPPLGQLYVLRKGMCIKNWRFLRSGRAWGDDMILGDRRLIDHSQAVALTFIELFSLSREAMVATCDKFAGQGVLIEKAAVRIRMQRALIMHYCEVEGKRPRSFVPQKFASGYFWVGPQMSTDDKISALYERQPLPSLGITDAEAALRITDTPPPSAPPPALVPAPPSASAEEARSTEARLDRLQTSVDLLAESFGCFQTSVTAQFAMADLARRQAKLSKKQKRPPPLPSSGNADDEVAPFSTADKSRPFQLQRVKTAATTAELAATADKLEA
jgi:hypothetical protein